MRNAKQDEKPFLILRFLIGLVNVPMCGLMDHNFFDLCHPLFENVAYATAVQRQNRKFNMLGLWQGEKFERLKFLILISIATNFSYTNSYVSRIWFICEPYLGRIPIPAFSGQSPIIFFRKTSDYRKINRPTTISWPKMNGEYFLSFNSGSSPLKFKIITAFLIRYD